MSDNPVLAYGRWLAETPPDWPDAAWEAAHPPRVDTRIGTALAG